MFKQRALSILALLILLSGCSQVDTTPEALEKLRYGFTLEKVQKTLGNEGRLLLRAKKDENKFEIRGYTPHDTFLSYALLFQNGSLQSVTPLGNVDIPFPSKYPEQNEKSPQPLESDSHLQTCLNQLYDYAVDMSTYDYKTLNWRRDYHKKRTEFEFNCKNLCNESLKITIIIIVYSPFIVLYAPFTVTALAISVPWSAFRVPQTYFRWKKIHPGMSDKIALDILGSPDTAYHYPPDPDKKATYMILSYYDHFERNILSLGIRKGYVEWVSYHPRGDGFSKVMLLR